jgi:hypothetical protein
VNYIFAGLNQHRLGFWFVLAQRFSLLGRPRLVSAGIRNLLVLRRLAERFSLSAKATPLEPIAAAALEQASRHDARR